MSTVGRPVSVRINMRFGARTDPEFLQDLKQLPSHMRSQWVRRWIYEGWRAGRLSETSRVKLDHSALELSTGATGIQSHRLPFERATVVRFDDEVAGLVGTSIV